MKITIRKCQLVDVAQITQLANQALETCWDKKAVEKDMKENKMASYIAAFDEDDYNELLGFANAWTFFGSTDIMQIAVKESQRHKGIGKMLLYKLMKVCREDFDSKEFILEVEETNTPAKELYRGCGFETIDIRKGYYPNGVNAVIMKKIDG